MLQSRAAMETHSLAICDFELGCSSSQPILSTGTLAILLFHKSLAITIVQFVCAE